MANPEQMSDHDLLIEIRSDVKTLVKQGDDHEMRIRRVERILYIGIGVAAATGSAIGSFVPNYFAS